MKSNCTDVSRKTALHYNREFHAVLLSCSIYLKIMKVLRLIITSCTKRRCMALVHRYPWKSIYLLTNKRQLSVAATTNKHVVTTYTWACKDIQCVYPHALLRWRHCAVAMHLLKLQWCHVILIMVILFNLMLYRTVQIIHK